MIIRSAREGDLPQILDLTDAKRRQYAEYQPVFHRPASGARVAQEPFLRNRIVKAEDIILVDEEWESIRGFIWAQLVNAPPVYDPGGKVCMVDDFVVRDPGLWATAGRALLDEARSIARERGAVLVNVVCGPLDAAKRALLTGGGYTVASEWHLRDC